MLEVHEHRRVELAVAKVPEWNAPKAVFIDADLCGERVIEVAAFFDGQVFVETTEHRRRRHPG